MKMKKIYGVNGMMEWNAELIVGRAKVRVPFTDGTLGGGTSSPGTFATENVAVMNLIEDSEAFKSGKIFLWRELNIMKNPTVNTAKKR